MPRNPRPPRRPARNTRDAGRRRPAPAVRRTSGAGAHRTTHAAGALTVQDIMRVERISQPAVSPSGQAVAYTVSIPDLKENKTRTVIRLLDLGTREVRELTPGPGDHSLPAFSPDGKWLAFASSREEKEGTQLWVLPLAGGEARRVTTGYGGVTAPLWAPDSRRIAFGRSVVVSPDYAPAKGEVIDVKSGPARAAVHGLVNRKSSARVADELLFRHWDTWRDRRRKHLFLVDTVTGKTEDLTPGNLDCPPISLGSARDYDFHPSGREIAFVMNPDAVVARSTNNSVYVLRLRGTRGVGEPHRVSTSDACDNHPRYSPDGSRIVYLAMKKPAYEADRRRIKMFHRDSHATEVFLERFDRSPESFEILPEDAGTGREKARRGLGRGRPAGRAPHVPTGSGGIAGVIFLAQERGREEVYRLDPGSGRVVQLTQGSTNGNLRRIPGSKQLLVTRETTAQPADLYLLTPGAGIRPQLQPGPMIGDFPVDAGSKAERLTRHADSLRGIRMHEVEEFWYKGAGGYPVHGFLVKPPRFDPRKKHPLILLIHGGPQSAFLDSFHFRWNVQAFAARGAVVAFLNPRGSTGYGQRFTDEISGDWGGRCFRDIMRGVDHLVQRHRYLDRRRIAAAGASFGGFMVNWIAGHTDRFRALVSHDGIFSAETMAYTTEELWFDEYEHGGLPHDRRSAFLKYSPHLFVKHFRTPTLVVQGEQDFRCPASEGIGMFTALQVKDVPSRLLWFPDEGHWVMQPANAEVWYHEVIGWLTRWLA